MELPLILNRDMDIELGSQKPEKRLRHISVLLIVKESSTPLHSVAYLPIIVEDLAGSERPLFD